MVHCEHMLLRGPREGLWARLPLDLGSNRIAGFRLVGAGDTFRGHTVRTPLAIAMRQRVPEPFEAPARFSGRGLEPSKCRDSDEARVESIAFSEANQPGAGLGPRRKS